MTTTSSSRKLVSALTPADLRIVPIWQVLSEDVVDAFGYLIIDDAWVQPLSVTSVPRVDGETYHVSASVTLRDGAKCHAFVKIDHFRNLIEFGQVTVFLGDTQHLIEASNPATCYGNRGISHAERSMLPLRWVLEVSLEGEDQRRKGSASPSRIVNFCKQLVREWRLQGVQQ